MMLAKFNAGICRKMGRPNYGSDGAHADFEVILSTHDPAEIAAEIRRAFELCELAVSEQLARMSGDTPAPPRTTTPPVAAQPAPASDRRQPSRHRYGGADTPQTGRQFYGWLKDEQAEGAQGLISHVEKWAKREGISARMVEWNNDVVADAVAIAERFLERASAATNGRG